MSDIDSSLQTKERCNAHLLNCIKLHNIHLPASVFLRELMLTAHCDQFSPELQKNRQNHEDFISRVDPNALDRLMKFQGTEKDEKIALQSVAHFNFGDRKSLIQGLPSAADRSMVSIGLFAAGYFDKSIRSRQ